MRRFSQRSHLVTLNEINITPLLDLAFVLLIIFVITTPFQDKGLDLSLPKVAGQPDRQLKKEDIRTVDIAPDGSYSINRRIMKLDQLVAQLAKDHQMNPNLVIYIRADENSRTKAVAALMDACYRNGLRDLSMRTEPPGSR